MEGNPNNRRVALVTGAAKRVGRAIALELASAGCDLAVHYRTSAAEACEVVDIARDMGVNAFAVRADLVVPSEIASMFDAVRAEFGRLDILVNSAAVFRRASPDRLSEADFDFHVNVNLKAAYLCSIHAARIMRQAGSGKIVNITDVAASRPMRNFVPYCVSKAGLEMLTRVMAKAYAPEIQVNAVAPGTVLFRDDETPTQRRKVISQIPRRRIGEPADVARAVRFLCEGSDHITGTVLLVDGGRSLY